MTDVLERARSEGRDTLTEVEAKELLSRAGVPVPDFTVVETPEEAVAAAETLGYPVVLKVSSPAIQHKSEWGDGAGVHLGLDDDITVRGAAERIRTVAATADLDCSMLVERSVETGKGVETIVGGTRDPSFGPVLVFGLGGTFTEVLEDVTHRLAPISPVVAEKMTHEIRGDTLLHGYRGSDPIDRTTLTSTIRTVGELIVDQETISEIEINPLLATTDGVHALDALVTLGKD